MLAYCLLFIFLAGFIKVLFGSDYFLMSLLGLEFMGLSVYFVSSYNLIGLNENFYLSFYILSMMVCESSLGLSILVMMSHSKNNCQLLNKVSLLC